MSQKSFIGKISRQKYFGGLLVNIYIYILCTNCTNCTMKMRNVVVFMAILFWAAIGEVTILWETIWIERENFISVGLIHKFPIWKNPILLGMGITFNFLLVEENFAKEISLPCRTFKKFFIYRSSYTITYWYVRYFIVLLFTQITNIYFI